MFHIAPPDTAPAFDRFCARVLEYVLVFHNSIVNQVITQMRTLLIETHVILFPTKDISKGFDSYIKIRISP